ncbi:MAG: GIY-YIG nuclease family protein [Symploca sp. SIO2C1]|nr:GIY-YIG nuclease family protein [Symploca sp. SIO2C1]
MVIEGYQFQGPYDKTGFLQERSGVYVILDLRRDGNYVIDVGESEALKTRIENHNRKNCWRRNEQGTLAVAVHYTPQFPKSLRRAIEQKIRSQYVPVCGIL